MTSPEIVGYTSISDTVRESEDNKFMAMCLIKQSDTSRYSDLLKRLSDNMNVGQDTYPTTLSSAYNLLLKENKPVQSKSQRKKKQGNNRFHGRADVNFATIRDNSSGDLIPGTDGRIFDVTCYGCQQRGHYRDKCPNVYASGTSTSSAAHVQQSNESTEEAQERGTTTPSAAHIIVSSFAQQHGVNKDIINKYWAILDTCSGASVFCNRQLVTDVRPTGSIHGFDQWGKQNFYSSGNVHFPPSSCTP